MSRASFKHTCTHPSGHGFVETGKVGVQRCERCGVVLKTCTCTFLSSTREPGRRWREQGAECPIHVDGPKHSKACMTTYLLSGDPNCPACGDSTARAC